MREDLIEALGAIADGMRDAGEHEDAAFLDRAAAALEAAREDAERYRWLRDLPMDAKETDWLWSYQGDALDAAIDAAIDQARGKGGPEAGQGGGE